MARSSLLRPATRKAIAGLFASSAIGVHSAALAQEGPSAATPAASLPSGATTGAPPVQTADAADIVVTATKRSERLQDVPISIQALGTATLEQHQVASVDDYVKLLPSVSYQSFGPGQSQLYFRGITSGADGLRIGPQPTTGTYLDEIPITTIGISVDLHIYDIDRVEALSGPQGTLFGASSEAGTLRIITNKPDTGKFSAGYDLEGNKFGKGNAGGVANAFVNVPLSDRAAIRLVGFYEHDGGYIDNTYATRTYTVGDADPNTNKTINNAAYVKKNFNDNDEFGGRIALKYDIDDNWTVTPQLIAQHQHSKGNFLYDPRAGDLKVHDFNPDYNVDRWYQAGLTIQGKLSNWDVTYAGSYFGRKVKNRTDYSYYSVAYDTYGSYATYFPTGNPADPFLDPSQQQLLHDTFTKMTHELRVSSPAEDRLRFTTGLFLERQTDKVQADFTVTGISGIPQPGAKTPDYPSGIVPVTGFGDDVFTTRIKRIDRDYAAFGEASFDIVPGVTLTGGIRGYIYKNTLTGFSGFETPDPINKKSDSSGETHKANLTWKIDRDHMVYATYSTGFRPGGANRQSDIAPYAPDTLDNYEVGFKTSWLDRKLRINGAFFYENWKNFQVTLTPAGAGGVNSTYNVAGAHSKGAEGDASLTLGGLVLSASGTYVDAKTTSSFASSRAVTPSGTRLPIQPKLKVTGTARYGFDLAGLDSFVQGSALHQSNTRSFLLNEDFDAVGTLPGFTTFDFSAGTKLSNRMTLEAYIQNAFDKRGQLSRNTACGPSFCGANYRVYPVKPQLFGIKVGQRF